MNVFSYAPPPPSNDVPSRALPPSIPMTEHQDYYVAWNIIPVSSFSLSIVVFLSSME